MNKLAPKFVLNSIVLRFGDIYNIKLFFFILAVLILHNISQLKIKEAQTFGFFHHSIHFTDMIFF